MQKLIAELTERLTKTFSDRLVSAILYGSAATGEYNRDYSDINVLCVLTRVTPAELRDSEPIFRWWRQKGNPAPLLLSEEEVRTAADCFPIEFHDIKERRRILAGRDLIQDLVIDDRYYRAQIEYQLRAKLLRLRQKAAGVLHDKVLLSRLLLDSISTFCILFRHALKLAGYSPDHSRRSVVEELGRRFQIDPAPLLQILTLREGKPVLNPEPPEHLFAAYLIQIQRVIDVVDRLNQPEIVS
ncbi:MAG: nucleotidyltransferase domain-containing protein [Bryobacteraceae bacterium]|nr:nucleotidyltransferase domain-containing protein [Bryobacteraceae bacterium]MDW8378847.1 nucleotidyltransferase domain-containing protein [Bryobacterales bacterium]